MTEKTKKKLLRQVPRVCLILAMALITKSSFALQIKFCYGMDGMIKHTMFFSDCMCTYMYNSNCFLTHIILFTLH